MVFIHISAYAEINHVYTSHASLLFTCGKTSTQFQLPPDMAFVHQEQQAILVGMVAIHDKTTKISSICPLSLCGVGRLLVMHWS